MSSLSRPPLSIQWHEGMLLSPEHFQKTDRRLDQLLGLHLRFFVPYFWGINKIDIDEAKLISGVLSIQTLEAILPDGTFALIHPEDDQVLELDIKEHQGLFNQDQLMVNLGISGYTPGSDNVTSEFPRFRSIESNPLSDENTGMGEKRVPLLKPNLLLLAGDTVSSRYESFPLLKVLKASNAFSVSRTYLPPQVRLHRGDILSNRLMELCATMREKLNFISNRLHYQRKEIMSDEAEKVLAVLSMAVVPLESMIRSSAVHPIQAYLFLTQVAGHISILDRDNLPPNFQPYNHHDMGQSFAEVISYIQSIMNQIQEGYFVIPFDLNERLFTLKLKPNYVTDPMIIGVRASKTFSTTDIETWMKGAVIATESHVTNIRDKRILGAPRKLVPRDEEMNLMPPRNVLLYAVDYDPSCIERNGLLCIFNVADQSSKRPEEITLYVAKDNAE